MRYRSALLGITGDQRFDRGLQPGNLIVEIGNRGSGDGLAITVHLTGHLPQHGPHIDMFGACHREILQAAEEGLLRSHRLKIAQRSPEPGQHHRVGAVGLGQMSRHFSEATCPAPDRGSIHVSWQGFCACPG